MNNYHRALPPPTSPFPARRIMSLAAAGESLEIVFFNLTLAQGLLLLLVELVLVWFDDSMVVTSVSASGEETKSPLKFSTSPLGAGALHLLGVFSELLVMYDNGKNGVGRTLEVVVSSLLESFILLEILILFLPPVDRSLQEGGR
jgi:hypothetical protein